MSGFEGSHVLAGFDGSPAGERALRWAAREAALRRLPLTVCHAWHWPYPVPPAGPDVTATVRNMGQHILDKGLYIARDVAPQAQVRGRLISGPSAAVLVNQSANATLTVVGAHGNGGFPESVIGSAAVQVPAYAPCPVIVVRDLPARDRPVVVGVDGSAASEAAVGFAFEEAALRGLPLHAVCGCMEPEAIASAELGMLTDPEDMRVMGARRLELTVAPWREKYPYVEARTETVMRTPRHALLEAAADASLLVLGGRGLGGVDGLRLGAVSRAMVEHAPCSVAVVRPRG